MTLGYAREHEPCIIFMDEIDAIGGRRFSEGTSADREIQRTLMEVRGMHRCKTGWRPVILFNWQWLGQPYLAFVIACSSGLSLYRSRQALPRKKTTLRDLASK